MCVFFEGQPPFLALPEILVNFVWEDGLSGNLTLFWPFSGQAFFWPGLFLASPLRK